jgi:predicted AlkP superfamily pyrophosphatase or phosphodiesterase
MKMSLGLYAALLVLTSGSALSQSVPPSVREISAPPQTDAVQRGPTVVYILLDGFRFDYVDWFDLKTLKAIRAEGASAPDGIFPSYPSVSGPNHVALMTGLLPTHSGIVANTFRDVSRGKTFVQFGVPESNDGSFYHGVPIWEAAERAGIRTAGMIWNGSGIDSHGVRMSHYEEYTGDTAIEGEPEVALFKKWLDLPAANRPHFYAIVLPQADHAGHRYGPDSSEVGTAAREIDGQIGEMRAALKAHGIDADLVIVADHGMAKIQGDWIDLDKFADLSHAKTAGSYIYADSEEVAQKIYQQLKGASPAFDVYRRKDLPWWLHYSDNPLVGDPVIIPRAAYLIRGHNDGKGDAHADVGTHHPWVGNTPEMRATFIAAGPHIRSGVQVESFRNVDVYPVVSTLLGLPAAPSDGTCMIANEIVQGRPVCTAK